MFRRKLKHEARMKSPAYQFVAALLNIIWHLIMPKCRCGDSALAFGFRLSSERQLHGGRPVRISRRWQRPAHISHDVFPASTGARRAMPLMGIAISIAIIFFIDVFHIGDWRKATFHFIARRAPARTAFDFQWRAAAIRPVLAGDYFHMYVVRWLNMLAKYQPKRPGFPTFRLLQRSLFYSAGQSVLSLLSSRPAS